MLSASGDVNAGVLEAAVRAGRLRPGDLVWLVSPDRGWRPTLTAEEVLASPALAGIALAVVNLHGCGRQESYLVHNPTGEWQLVRRAAAARSKHAHAQLAACTRAACACRSAMQWRTECSCCQRARRPVC